MSKKVEQFPFYITYMDVNLYIFNMMGNCADENEIARLIDSTNFMDQCDNPQKYKINADELLLNIRQFFVDNGLEKEVEACDMDLAEEGKNRGKKNPYIPMHKRWEMDDETARRTYRKDGDS